MSTLEEKIKILRTKSKVIDLNADGVIYHYTTRDKKIKEAVNVDELRENLRILFKIHNIDFKTSLDALMLDSNRIKAFAEGKTQTKQKKLTYLKYYYFLTDCLNRHLEAKSYYDLMFDLANINCISLHTTLQKMGMHKQTYYFIKNNQTLKYNTTLTKRIKKGSLAIKEEILALIKKHATEEDYQYWASKSDTILITSLDSLIKEYPFLSELNYIKNK